MEVKFDIFENGRRPKKNQIKNKESKQPKTNKNKNNGCGTAPGNLVWETKIIWCLKKNTLAILKEWTLVYKTYFDIRNQQ